MLGRYRLAVLDNGVRVLGVENADLHSFVMSTHVHAGPRFETDGQAGLTHLLEHMLFQGSEHYPDSKAIMRGIENLGGVIDGGTYPEYLSAAVGVHRKHWRAAVDVACDVLLSPRFDPLEIRQERLIISQELSPHRDAEGRVISATELAHCMRFKEKLSESGMRGSTQLLATFDRRALCEHYGRHFRGGSIVVCLSGGFDFDEVLGAVSERLSGFAEGSVVRAGLRLPPAEPDGNRCLFRHTEAQPVCEVVLSYPAPSIREQAFDACLAVSHLLGGSMSSRLFTQVREEQGLAYEVESHLQGYSDTGSLDCFLSVDAENVVEAVKAVLAVVREVGRGGLEADELARYKEGVRCGVEMLCDRAAPLADWFGKRQLLLGSSRAGTPEEYVRAHEALTLEDLAESARRMFEESPADLIVVGPFGGESESALREVFPAVEVRPTPR